jgi:nucleotide sugar dehydrogenase
MGLPLAAVFADSGFTVIGVGKTPKNVSDINAGKSPVVGEDGLEALIQKVVKKKKLIATTDGIWASKKSDVKVIIIPTYLNKVNKPDLSIVKDVTEKIAGGLQKGDIVILESTAPPGTTIKFIGGLLEKKSGLRLNHDFAVAHCPERTNSGTAISDIRGRINPKVVAGSDDNATKAVEWIYRKINKRGVIIVENPTVAELVKVSEGLYRDLNIAFANNLYLLCRELGVNANDVIKAANTDAVCHILSPGPGVGGHCIPIYPYFMLDSVKNNKALITLARQINDNMSYQVIDLATDALQSNGKKLKDANILILGFTYRGGVKETRKSPALKVAKEISRKCKKVFAFDPFFNESETKEYHLHFKKDFANIDCVLILANHKEFKKLNWKKIGTTMNTKIVVDTVNIIDSKVLTKLGFTTRQIGYEK